MDRHELARFFLGSCKPNSSDDKHASSFRLCRLVEWQRFGQPGIVGNPECRCEPGLYQFDHSLTAQGYHCDEAVCGKSGWEAAQTGTYDLILLDVMLPQLPDLEVLKRLREQPPSAHLKIIMNSGSASPDEMSHMLIAGADDYLSKPFSIVQLQGRVQTALRIKDAQDRSALLNRQLLTVNAELEHNLQARNTDMVQSRAMPDHSKAACLTR
jgi:CheY-like chemotaxis protein